MCHHKVLFVHFLFSLVWHPIDCRLHSDFVDSESFFAAWDKELFPQFSCVSLYAFGGIPFPLHIISVPFTVHFFEKGLDPRAISNAKKLSSEGCLLHVFFFANSWNLTQAVTFLLSAVRSSSVNRRGTFVFFDERYDTNIDKLTIEPVIVHLGTVLYVKRDRSRQPPHHLRYRIYKSRYNEPMTVYSWDGKTLSEPRPNPLTFPGHVVPNKTITAGMFEFPPSIIIKKNEPDPLLRFSGHDSLLIRMFAERAKLNLQIIESTDSNRWGFELPNGTWVGLMGELVGLKVDVVIAEMFMIPERLQVIDMTYPYDISCTTFLTPAPQPVPRWKALVQPFNTVTWIVSSLSVVFASFFIWFLANAYAALLQRNPGPFYQQGGLAAFYTVQMVTGCPGMEDRSRWPLRIYNSFAWTFFFVITLYYRASLTALLSIPANNPPIDTLKDLAKSGLDWGSFGNVIPYFGESVDPYARELVTRIHSVSNENNVDIARVANGTFAFFETDLWNDYVRSTMYLDKYGRPTLHVMKECHITFPISIALQKDSPLLESLNTFLLGLPRTGLLTMWKKAAVVESKATATGGRSNFTREQEDALVLTLYKLQGPFILWGIGVLVSLFSFACEKLAVVLSTYNTLR